VWEVLGTARLSLRPRVRRDPGGEKVSYTVSGQGNRSRVLEGFFVRPARLRN
jgi:hypothetical protein